MKKRTVSGALVLALAAAGLAASSASGQSKAIDETSCRTAGGFCVGLVIAFGHVDEQSFNQSAWQGVQAAASSLGGFAKYLESVEPKDFASNIDSFAAKKYKVIVTVGSSMAVLTEVAAKKYPGIKFIGIDQFNGGTDPNYSGVVFPEDKAGFIVGYLAGYLTKSNKVAAVLSTNTVPATKRYGDGYQNGIAYAAKERGKKIKTTLVYHGGASASTDPAWGASTASKLLAQGYDVIFGVGGKTAKAALGRVAKKKNAFCIGANTDRWATVPEAHACLVTSATKLISSAVSQLINRAWYGAFVGGNFIGDVGIAPYHDFSKKVPTAVQKKVAALAAKVLSGAIPTECSGKCDVPPAVK